MNLEYRYRVANIGGVRALVVDADIPDDAPPDVREGLARRAIVNSGGTCPCGARMVLPNRAERRAGASVAAAWHEPDCPALDVHLAAAIRRWEARR